MEGALKKIILGHLEDGLVPCCGARLRNNLAGWSHRRAHLARGGEEGLVDIVVHSRRHALFRVSSKGISMQIGLGDKWLRPGATGGVKALRVPFIGCVQWLCPRATCAVRNTERCWIGRKDTIRTFSFLAQEFWKGPARMHGVDLITGVGLD